jgi:hypothetical protein
MFNLYKKVPVEKIIFQQYFFFFFLAFGFWSQSADKLTIHSLPCSWILKPTIPQSPPSHLQDYSICNNARLEFSTNFVPSFDPIEWCLKNGLHSGGSNSQPFSHESSALTTRPRLLVWTMKYENILAALTKY